MTGIHVNQNALQHLTRVHVNQNMPFKEGSNENCVLLHSALLQHFCDVGVLCERKQTPSVIHMHARTHAHTHTLFYI